MTRTNRIEGKTEHRKICDLEEAVKDLLAIASDLDCRLVAFSEHELTMVNQHLPQNAEAKRQFASRFYNIRPKAKSLANRRHLDFDDNTLVSLLTALSPGHKWPPPPQCGVAEACRRLRQAGANNKRWRKWHPRHQQIAMDLIRYNRGDCLAVWRLVNRVVSNYRIRELE